MLAAAATGVTISADALSLVIARSASDDPLAMRAMAGLESAEAPCASAEAIQSGFALHWIASLRSQ
jgi:hypothetical protein